MLKTLSHRPRIEIYTVLQGCLWVVFLFIDPDLFSNYETLKTIASQYIWGAIVFVPCNFYIWSLFNIKYCFRARIASLLLFTMLWAFWGTMIGISVFMANYWLLSIFSAVSVIDVYWKWVKRELS